MTPRMRVASRMKKLSAEVAMLRGKIVEQDIYSTAKYEAMREFVNQKISRWNAAIRATNGILPGESMQRYQARLVAANRPPNAAGNAP